MTIPSAGEPRQPKQLLQNDPFTQPGYTDNFYDAVGGHDTFVRLIDVFYDGVATDPLLRPMYPEEDLEPAKRRFLMFLEQYWGGPTTYGEERGHPSTGPRRGAAVQLLRLAVHPSSVPRRRRVEIRGS